MNFTPNTKLYLLSGVPLEPDYKNTIYFESKVAQTAFFQVYQKFSVLNQTYQRVNNNTIRVAYVSDILYDCNYMMFQNADFGDKWFYAFIDSINYVNNGVSEIKYTIDVMQTWFFDYELQPCYVEREHSTTDAIFSSEMDEDLSTGNYMVEYKRDLLPNTYDRDYRIVFVTQFNNDSSLSNGTGYLQGALNDAQNKTYSGLRYHVFTTVQSANEFYDRVVTNNKVDGIVAIYMIPYFFEVDSNYSVLPYEIPKYQSVIDGYTPRNKKLLQYPYNYLKVSTDSGEGEYRYEFFGGNQCQFALSCTSSAPPSCSLIPFNYEKGQGTITDYKYTKRLSLAGFPTCSLNADAYKVYIAANQNTAKAKVDTYIESGITNIASGLANLGTGEIGKGLSGLFEANLTKYKYNEYIATIQDVKTKAPEITGTLNISDDWSSKCKTFIFSQVCIPKDVAMRLDDYFDLYGYRVNRVKVPNRKARKHWTYLKTVGCALEPVTNTTTGRSGFIPADDATKIASIYDNGVRFWTDGSKIGKYIAYRSDNTPL